MPMKTGKEYITGLRDRPREVWIRGERVKDVTSHPSLANGVRPVASLYDLQHNSELKGEMAFKSPSTGELAGMSFQSPKTANDLEKRLKMMTRWA